MKPDSSNTVVASILQLKEERRALILAHNYQPAAIQDLADFVGDSLELSRQAAQTRAEVIVFCGVHFMAETAFILSPDKTVLLPDEHAGCPMADMVTVEQLKLKKAELPGARVVCYVNSSAAVKAESDICCTSANAVKVISSLPPGEIIFVPDRYLGQWVAAQTGRQMHLWPGYCPVHERILPRHILSLKQKYPRAEALVHPECRPETAAAADAVLSTGGMCRRVQNSDAPAIIVGTETGIIHRLQKENPGKQFIPALPLAVCPDMKRITPEKILHSLEDLSPRITVPEGIRSRARVSIQRMLEISRAD
jgi:quinolinate synthase